MEINRNPSGELPEPESELPIRDLFQKSRLASTDFILGASFHRGPNRRRRNYRLVVFSWAASLIDTLLGFALSMMVILASSLLMKVSFVHLLNFFHGSLYFLALTCFVASVGLYKLILRIYLGFTIGEWACGLRLGSPKERISPDYVWRVFLRFAVVFGTGILVLPIMSIVLGQDVAGRISGLYLVEK